MKKSHHFVARLVIGVLLLLGIGFWTSHFVVDAANRNVGGTLAWDNQTQYLDSDFWAASPTTGDIITALYGSGDEGTVYTDNWSGYDSTSCLDAGMNVVYTGNLSLTTLADHTIYVLTGLISTGAATINMADCSAIVSSNTTGTTFYSTVYLSTGMLYADTKQHIILDNLAINGTGGGIVPVHTGNFYGIYVRNFSNNSFNNIQAYNNSNVGIWLYSSNNNSLTNIQAYDNTSHGIYLYTSSNNNSLNNIRAYNNGANGIYLYTSSGNSLTDIQTYNNDFGIYLYTSSGNSLTDIQIYGNNNMGIEINASSSNSLTNIQTYNNGNEGIFLYNSANNSLNNIQTYDNTSHGIYLYTSSNNSLTNIVSHTNTSYGILFTGSSNNTLSGVQIYSNIDHGIKIYASSNNVVNNIQTYNNDNYGMYMEKSSGNSLSDMMVYNNTNDGMYFYSSSGNSLDNTQVYNNGNEGIYLYASSNNSFNNIQTYNNEDGFYLNTASNNAFNNIQAYNNSRLGIYFQNSVSNSLHNIQTYNNNSDGLEFNSSSTGNRYYGSLDIFGNTSTIISRSGVHLTAGTGIYYTSLGRTTGSLNTGITMSWDYITNPLNTSGNYMLGWGLSLTGMRMQKATYTSTTTTGYSFGNSIFTQVQPVHFSGASLITGGTFDTTKFVGSTIAKVDGSLVISGGSSITTSNVTVIVTGSGTPNYRLFGDIVTEKSGSFATSLTTGLTLSGTSGIKSIFAQIRTNSNRSTHYVDDITFIDLSGTPIVGTGYISSGSTGTNGGNLYYHGLIDIKASVLGNNITSCSYTTGVSLVTGTMGLDYCEATGLNFTSNINVRFRATNSSGSTFGGAQTYYYDGTAPSGGSFSINTGASTTNSTSVTLVTTCASDAGVGGVQVAFGNTSGATNRQTCTGSMSRTLTTGDGVKTVYMRFRDAFGNTGADITDTITLDTLWDNSNYLNQTFWNNNPSTGNIVEALYGSGNGGSVYTTLWSGYTSSSCLNSGMQVVFTGSLPASIAANTVYVLASGTYNVASSVTMANCSALISSGTVIFSGAVGSNPVLTSSGKNNIILENIYIDGANSAGAGIEINNGINFTLNGIRTYNNTTNGISLITSSYGKLRNVQSYDNTSNGIYLSGASHNNLITNTSITTNGADGISVSGSPTNTFTGCVLSGNSGNGIQLNVSPTNTISNTTGNNNSTRDIYIVNTTGTTISRFVGIDGIYELHDAGSFQYTTYDSSTKTNNTIYLYANYDYSASLSASAIGIGSSFSNYARTLRIKDIFSLTGVTTLTVGGASRDGTIYAPMEISAGTKLANVGEVGTTNITSFLGTMEVISGNSYLTMNGGSASLKYSFLLGNIGDSLRILKSNDGVTRTTNTAQPNCVLDSNLACTFVTTGSMKLFAFGTLFSTLPSVGTAYISSGTTGAHNGNLYYKGLINIRATIAETGTCEYTTDGSTRSTATYHTTYCEKTGLSLTSDIDVAFRLTNASGAVGVGSSRTYLYDGTAPAPYPFFERASQSTGTDDANIESLTRDTAGNIYIAGHFYGTGTFGNTTLVSSGGYDAFVAKLSSTGQFLWAIKGGGTNTDLARGIDVDSAGNVYVVGYFQRTGTFGATTLTGNGIYNGFYAKISSNGSYLWANKIDGYLSIIRDINVDSYGDIYMAGYFDGTGTFGTTTLVTSGNYDPFVARLSSTGAFLRTTKGGGIDDNYATEMDLDSVGNIYIAGRFEGTGTFGTATLVSSGGHDSFVAKLSSTGQFLRATKGGGIDADNIDGIDIDTADNVYVAGSFEGTGIFGNTTLVSNGGIDSFVAKLSSTGQFLRATKGGGVNNDYAYGIDIDNAGDIYVAGSFYGTGTFGNIVLMSPYYNSFITKLSSSGNYLWTKQGNSNFDAALGIVADNLGNTYVGGHYGGAGMFGNISLEYVGVETPFVAKINSGSDTTLFTINNGATYATGTNVTLTINCPVDAGVGGEEIAYGTGASPTNWMTCTSGAALTLPATDGTKTVYMRTRDVFGNVSSDTTDTIVLDVAGPIMTGTSPATGSTVILSNNITFTWSESEPNISGHIVYVTQNGSAYASGTTTTATTLTINNIPNGTGYARYVVGTDTFGHTGTFSPIPFSINVPLSGTIALSGSQLITISNVKYTTTTFPILMSANKNFNYIVTGDSITTATGVSSSLSAALTLTASGADGVKTFYVTLYTGNESISATLAGTLDTTKPTDPVLSSPASGYIATGASVTLTWTASTDAGIGISGYQWIISNTGTFATTTTAGSTTGLTVSPSTALLGVVTGTFYWKVIAFDRFGFTGESLYRDFYYSGTDATPDNFTFPAITGARLERAYLSSGRIITGMSVNMLSFATINRGILYISGNEVGQTGYVRNGDTVQIELISSDEYEHAVTSTLTIGDFATTFRVTTEAEDNNNDIDTDLSNTQKLQIASIFLTLRDLYTDDSTRFTFFNELVDALQNKIDDLDPNDDKDSIDALQYLLDLVEEYLDDEDIIDPSPFDNDDWHVAPNGRIYQITYNRSTKLYTSPDFLYPKTFADLNTMRAYIDVNNGGGRYNATTFVLSGRNHTVDQTRQSALYIAPNGKSYRLFKTTDGRYSSYNFISPKYFISPDAVKAHIALWNK